MKVIRISDDDISSQLPQVGVLAMGNFDGLHLGHQSLLKAARLNANQLQCSLSVFSFDPHPLKILRPGKELKQIWPREEVFARLTEFSVDTLVTREFTPELAQKSPAEFLESELLRLQPKAVWVGKEFRFGRHRTGDVDFLKSVLAKEGVSLHHPDLLTRNGEKVSSGRVRDALEKGDLQEAKAMLGEDFYLKGHVVTGDQRGGKIGFPTANIETSWDLFLRPGVYQTDLSVDGVSYPSITNVGVVPTFTDGHRMRVESHVLDFNQDIYRKDVMLTFRRFIRDERKFSGREELVAQIKKDIQSVRG